MLKQAQEQCSQCASSLGYPKAIHSLGGKTLRQTRILIVEDEAIEALDLEHRLDRLGYHVEGVAFSGEEAIGAFEKSTPDLVLMDIMLRGELDGIATVEIIQKRWRVPVIFITAYADRATVDRAKLTGPYAYLVKPFRERELEVAIEMALYKHAMEQKLQKSEEWLATTLRSIGDAVMATDNQGLITFMNPVAEELTGWQISEVRGRHLVDVVKIINQVSRLPVENPVALVLRENRVVGLANHSLLVTRDGREIPIDDSAAPIRDNQGRIIGVILVFRDVSERVEAQAQLQRAHDELEKRVHERTADLMAANERLRQEIVQRKRAESTLQQKTKELAEANQAKDRFLASMSHELRTPLNAILGFTGILQMGLSGPLTTEQEHHLNYIYISARQLLLLIDQLLDLAKIQSGRVDKFPAEISCCELLTEVGGMLRPLATSNDLQLVVVSPEPDIRLISDRRLLMQILQNLIYNAIKFTEQGEVRISAELDNIRAVPQVAISVADTGIGIREEDQPALFEAFARVSTKAGPEGTGLGLHLCKNLADVLGGTITIDSQYGKGSVFTLLLPLNG